jgi:hypothetical protein
MDAKRYLATLKLALERGDKWNKSWIVKDVLWFAHMLRCIKLSPKLANSYLCIHYPGTEECIVLKIEDVPHHNIAKLREWPKWQGWEDREAFAKAFQGVNADITHVTFMRFKEGRQLESLLYFRDACDRLMVEKGWTTYEELPQRIAREAKKRGMSATKNDLTRSIHIPKTDWTVEELLEVSENRLPGKDDIRCFLERSGMVFTEAAVEDVHVRCIGTLARRISNTAQGFARKGVCQNPTCSREQQANKTRLFCSVCRRAAYCSKECQKADWRQHKRGCISGTVAAFQSQEFAKDFKEFKDACATKSVFM